MECVFFLTKSLFKNIKKIFFQYDECYEKQKRIEEIEMEKKKNKEIYEIFLNNLQKEKLH